MKATINHQRTNTPFERCLHVPGCPLLSRDFHHNAHLCSQMQCKYVPRRKKIQHISFMYCEKNDSWLSSCPLLPPFFVLSFSFILSLIIHILRSLLVYLSSRLPIYLSPYSNHTQTHLPSRIILKNANSSTPPTRASSSFLSHPSYI